jgi:hypothetical protein
MKLPDLTKLCTPAQLYLFVELILLIIMLIQNGNSDNTLCLGNYECYEAPNKALMLLVKLGYVGFWTFVLNLICKAGYKNLSWFLVLLPVILFFTLLVLVLGPWNYNESSSVLIMEGMENPTSSETSNTNNSSNLTTANQGAVFVRNKLVKVIEQRIRFYETIKKSTKGNDKMYNIFINDMNNIKNVANDAVNKVK